MQFASEYNVNLANLVFIFLQFLFYEGRTTRLKTATDVISTARVNPLTTGAAYVRVFIFYYHIKYHLLNMLKIKWDIYQQYLKTVDLYFVKSE